MLPTDLAPTPLKPWQFRVYDLALDLAAASVAQLNAARDRLYDAGFSITTLAALLEAGDAALESVYALHDRCYRLQPPAAAHDEAIPYRLWRWGSLEARDALPDAYFVVFYADQPAGLSTAVRLPRLAGVLHSRFTGVAPEHQGRGVATALKASTIAYGIEHGYRELRATVLAANAPMLHVNEAFGFERVREYVTAYPQLTFEKRRGT